MIFFNLNSKEASFEKMATYDRITFLTIYSKCVNLLPSDTWPEQCDLARTLLSAANLCEDSAYKTSVLQFKNQFNIKSDTVFTQFNTAIFLLGDIDEDFGNFQLEEMAVWIHLIAVDNNIEPMLILARKLLELVDISEDKLFEAADNGEDWREYC